MLDEARDNHLYEDGSQDADEQIWRILSDLISSNVKPEDVPSKLKNNIVNLRIPKNITKIDRGGVFADCANLQSVFIPSTVQSIGEQCFSGCSKLKTIVFEDGVQLIGNNAFANCISLESIALPGSVKFLGQSAFYRCINLKEVSFTGLNQSIQDIQSIDKRLSKMGVYKPISKSQQTSISSIQEFTFAECVRLEKISLPSTLNDISNYAFTKCEKLTSIDIPDDVVHIGEGAFSFCKRLNAIKIPNGVKAIEKSTFRRCVELVNVLLPDNLESIDSLSFFGCSRIVSIQMPKTVNYIGEKAFAKCEKLLEVTVPDAVESIGDLAFANCVDLRSVSFSDTSTCDIGENAFFGCPKLKGIEDEYAKIRANIKELHAKNNMPVAKAKTPEEIKQDEEKRRKEIEDKNAAEEAKRIKMANDAKQQIQDILSQIDNGTIYYDSLPNDLKSIVKSIDIPDNITKIEKQAFKDCISLEEIVIPNSVAMIASGAFEGCEALKSVNIPNSVKYIYPYAFRDCKSLKSATLPNQLAVIYEAAFENCTSLVEIAIPDSVVKIESNVFNGCTSLKKVNISQGLTSIQSYVFAGCKELQTVEIPNTIKSIGVCAFDSIGQSTKDSYIIIPASVKRIDSKAFNDAGQTTITIFGKPDMIGENAFSRHTDKFLMDFRSQYSIDNDNDEKLALHTAQVIFKDMTFDEVKSMKNFPWGIDDIRLIKCKA